MNLTNASKAAFNPSSPAKVTITDLKILQANLDEQLAKQKQEADQLAADYALNLTGGEVF